MLELRQTVRETEDMIRDSENTWLMNIQDETTAIKKIEISDFVIVIYTIDGYLDNIMQNRLDEFIDNWKSLLQKTVPYSVKYLVADYDWDNPVIDGDVLTIELFDKGEY